MISKKLLENVVAWEHCYYSLAGGYSAEDHYTLRFRQWWKRKLVIKFTRKVMTIDPEDSSFTHRMSPESTAFRAVLVNHIKHTFGETTTSPPKCPVLKVVPDTTEEKTK